MNTGAEFWRLLGLILAAFFGLGTILAGLVVSGLWEKVSDTLYPPKSMLKQHVLDLEGDDAPRK
jgi:hypothetical protein